MNNIKDFIKNLIKKLQVLIYFKKVTWQDKLIHVYKKNKSLLFIILGLVIFSSGLIYILNRKEGFSFKKTYSTNEIKDAINLQAELYYDPVNYFVYNEDVQLVDIRRKENFQNEHINTSINIPAEIDKTNPSEFSNKKELIEAFQKLDSKKDIVILGENSNSLVPIHVAGVLAEKQIRVKIMTIGWNEFRNLQTFWLPEQLWGKVNIMDFVDSNQTTN